MAGTLSAFFDESGQEMKFEPDTKHYLLTIVLHDQGSPIAEEIAKYESLLSESSVPDVPFHFYDLCHARNGYEGLDFETRKRLFVRFSSLVRRLPITYMTFSYRRSEFADAAALSDRMCQERRLAQVADYLCSIELAALRYADHEETDTYKKLFGSARTFKANLLKQVRRKLHR